MVYFSERVAAFNLKVCNTDANYDPGLTLTYFLARSNFATESHQEKNCFGVSDQAVQLQMSRGLKFRK